MDADNGTLSMEMFRVAHRLMAHHVVYRLVEFSKI